MHDGMPYGRNQGQGQGHSREVDRQSPTGLIFKYFFYRFLAHQPQGMNCPLPPSLRFNGHFPGEPGLAVVY